MRALLRIDNVLLVGSARDWLLLDFALNGSVLNVRRIVEGLRGRGARYNASLHVLAATDWLLTALLLHSPSALLALSELLVGLVALFKRHLGSLLVHLIESMVAAEGVDELLEDSNKGGQDGGVKGSTDG